MELEILKNKVEDLIDQYDYNTATNVVVKALNIKMKIGQRVYDSMPWDKEGVQRYIFEITISRDNDRYTFNFGQSIANEDQEPTMYDILSCLTFEDPESLEDFCNNYGYDFEDGEDVYERVESEYQTLSSMFNSEEMGILQLIR